jgi:hypothetical protein
VQVVAVGGVVVGAEHGAEPGAGAVADAAQEPAARAVLPEVADDAQVLAVSGAETG